MNRDSRARPGRRMTTRLDHLHLQVPSWVPYTATVRRICGKDFEAVRVPAGIAEPAYIRLGAAGPVIASAYTGIWYWLFDAREITAAQWDVPGTRLMPAGRAIHIPPAATATGPDAHWAHWIVPPGRGRTQPEQLHRALAGTRVAPPGRSSLPAA
ncbi:hypothetical protein AB0N09_30750 [Streptomyces erythrochromogenes]|uniref:hypothetical protein n=1 Tax=Streptomyces erythrochromogenes TaxID=285574 RepID=UPI003413EF37